MSNKSQLQDNNTVLSEIYETMSNNATGHINNKNNPHDVTAEQIGAVGCNTPMTFSVTAGGILQVTYDDGL